MTHSNESDQESGYTTGVILGTLLGSVSFFLFGTKTGQKIKKQFSEEYSQANVDLKNFHQKTNQKLEEFFNNTPILKTITQKMSDMTIKSSITKTTAKSKKNFFSKKGKKLG